MAPALAAAIPGVLTGLGTLFGGGPKIPNYSPEEMLRNFQMFYRQLQNGPLGQQMLGNASRGASLYRNSLAGAQAASGMGSTGIGLARTAGAGAIGSIARNDVLAQLAQMAQSLSQQSLAGMTQSGMTQYMNPHGLQALLGILGTSAYPLMQANLGGAARDPGFAGGGASPWFPNYAGGAALRQSPGAMQSMSPTSPPFGGTSPFFPSYRGR
jgi:hypothetical protein